MTDHIEDRILYALFCLSRATLPIDAAALADAAGVSTVAAGKALVGLEKSGLVDATRARLTMVGLAKAVSLKADLGGTAPVATKRARAPRSAALPMAARPAADAEDERPALQA